MLILTRKRGETIKIGKFITITIVNVDRGTVKIGINAPKVTDILRGELLNENELEKSEDVSR